jgi:hypothetical protein
MAKTALTKPVAYSPTGVKANYDANIDASNANFVELYAEHIWLNHAGTLTPYVPSAATDAARGTALLAALAAAVSGDTLLLGPGTYDCGTHADMSAHAVVIPAGVTVTGSGIGATTIQVTAGHATGSTYHYQAINMGDGARLSNLSLRLIDTAFNKFSFGIGPADSAEIWIENVYINGDTDAVFISADVASSTIHLTNVEATGHFDTYNDTHSAIGSAHLLYMDGCYFHPVCIPAYSQTSYRAVALSYKCAAAYLSNCRLSADDTGSTLGNARALELSSTNYVELHNCDIRTINTLDASEGDVYYQSATAANQLIISGCTGSGPGQSLRMYAPNKARTATQLSVDVADRTTLGAETLTNGALTSGTDWTAAGEMTCASNAATYTFASTGAGSLTQANAKLVAPTPGVWYRLQYTVSASPTIAPGTCATLDPAFAGYDDTGSYAHRLSLTAGIHELFFKSAAGAAAADFKITIASATAGAFTIDALSLKRVIGGNVSVAGSIQAGSIPVYANNAAAIAGGLTFGKFYRTGGDPDPVCIVH